jgi:hypothetical protein
MINNNLSKEQKKANKLIEKLFNEKLISFKNYDITPTYSKETGDNAFITIKPKERGQTIFNDIISELNKDAKKNKGVYYADTTFIFINGEAIKAPIIIYSFFWQ